MLRSWLLAAVTDAPVAPVEPLVPRKKEANFCSTCGEVVKPGKQFCTRCGAPL